MSFIPTQGNSILVDTPESVGEQSGSALPAGWGLSSWLMGKAKAWEAIRNRQNPRWAEYWRIWRGQWVEEDRNRLSERSRLIAPALANAIEQSVSEVEEGVFSKDAWFDLADDIQDQEKLDSYMARDQLLEDFALAHVPDTVSEAVLCSAIFGTGIIKLNTTVVSVENDRKQVLVIPENIRPDEFIPDPSAKRIGDMLGSFHKLAKVPLHKVLEGIQSGRYRKDALRWLGPQGTPDHNWVDSHDPEAMVVAGDADSVSLHEYHGKVPLRLLQAASTKRTPLDEVIARDLRERPELGDGPLVEAIVTIANESIILRAEVNPFARSDRSIIAFQWEPVPGRFWGRGVAEKGYNPQKALDAEVRSRIDSLGYISAPMVAVDASRVPRGFKMQVKPGKVWLTQGPPSDVFQPIKLGNLEQGSFVHGQEMERMVQMGTGSFDTAGPLGQQSSSGASAAGSNSMLMGAFVKRSKRAIRNIDNNLLQPLIKKSLWRYNQFAPSRYPQADYKFVVKATLGIVAREVENAQLTQLLGMMPEGFGNVGLVVIRGIIENSSVTNKGQIFQEIEKALQPDPEAQQKQKMLESLEMERVVAEVRNMQAQNQKLMAEIREILTKAEVNRRKAETEDDKVDIEAERTRIAREELENFSEQNRIAEKRLELQEKALSLRARQQSSK